MTKDHEQKHREPDKNRLVVAYVAGSTAEALVIRGLLESNGIKSPEPTTTDPFPLNEPPEGTHGPEIYTLEQQAEEARRIIETYRRSSSAAPSK